MTLTSYAQNFEDVVLWRALRDVEGGRYVDIGAQDPTFDSISRAFYEAGWRGIHVEPTPRYAARLRQERPDETVIEAAVTDALGPIEFHEIPETGLSTGRADIARRHGASGFECRKIVVPCIRLDKLLEVAGDEVHWLKIDVEGMEADVLRSWGDSARRPWVLVIEATFPTSAEPTHQLWIEEVSGRGYSEVFFDGLSRYFLHDSHADLASRFAASVNIFDDFVVSSQHFVAGPLSREIEAGTQRLAEQQARGLDLEQRLEAATHAREAARAEQAQLLQDLLASEREHRAAIEEHWRERQIADEKLRREFGEKEIELRSAVERAEVKASSANVALARLEERATQLEDRRLRAEDGAKAAAEQLAEARRETFEVQRQLSEHVAALERAERDRSELGAEIERHRATAARTNAVIKDALADRPDRWSRIGWALGLSQRGRGWQALAEWHSAASSPTALSSPFDSEGVEPNMLRPAQEPHSFKRANSLSELLSLHGADFVRSAYVTVLGREPDEVGEAYYVERLRSGYSQLHLLAQLRFSEEGQDHDPGIGGFDRALRRARRERMPILGALARAISGNSWEAPRNRILRALFENNGLLHARMDQVEERLVTVDQSLQALSAGLSRQPVASEVKSERVQPKRKPVRVPPIIEASRRIRSEWLGA